MTPLKIYECGHTVLLTFKTKVLAESHEKAEQLIESLTLDTKEKTFKVLDHYRSESYDLGIEDYKYENLKQVQDFADTENLYD